VMTGLRELIRSGHIHVSLALGVSIILLAYVSKHLLDTPIKSLYLAVPSFIMLGYETLIGTKKYPRLTKSVYWVVAILLVTTIIIIAHLT
jgi:hypothetical protein